MKKFTWLVLAVFLLTLVLSGCGGSKANLEDDTSKEVTLKWIMLTFEGSPKDLAKVTAKANEYLKDKLNCKIEIMFIPIGDYDQKVTAMTHGGDDYDLVFTSIWANNYARNAQNGMFMPLDDMLNQYGAEMKKALPEMAWNGTKIKGVNYAVPTNKDFGARNAYYFNKNTTVKYPFDYGPGKKLRDWFPLFEKYKADNPGKVAFRNGTSVEMSECFDYLIESGIPGAIKLSDKSGKVINQFESAEYLEAFKDLREAYLKGYTYKAIPTENNRKDFQTGKLLTCVEPFPPYGDLWREQSYKMPLLASAVSTTTTCTTGMLMDSMTAINVNSKNPARAMKFINLMNTDSYLHNLLVFGIEGEHYTKIGENQIKRTQAGEENYSMPDWEMGNMFINYVMDNEPVDKWKKFAEFNTTVVPSPALGFVFDPQPVNAEISALKNVMEQYYPTIAMGMVDYQTALPEMNAKLKAAGLDKLLAEVQKQLDEWNKTKK